MFGSGLPVLAHDFACLRELVRDGDDDARANGWVFGESAQLAAQMQDALRGFPDSPALASRREGVRAWQQLRWQDNWDAHVRPLFARGGGGAE